MFGKKEEGEELLFATSDDNYCIDHITLEGHKITKIKPDRVGFYKKIYGIKNYDTGRVIEYHTKDLRNEHESMKKDYEIALNKISEMYYKIQALCPHKVLEDFVGCEYTLSFYIEEISGYSYKCILCGKSLKKVPKGSKVKRTKEVLEDK